LNSASFTPVSTRKAIAILILGELFIVVISFVLHGTSLAFWQTTTRFSGRFSLLVFSALFILQADKRSYLLHNHGYLIFAIAHGIHLIELLIFIALSQRDLIPIRLAGGFLAYLIIFVMPWIEYQYGKGKISDKAMVVLENVGLYYIWFIFLMAYIPRILGKLPDAGGTFIEHLFLFYWVLIILGWRFIRQFKGYIAKNN
jgi:hypothetical protein